MESNKSLILNNTSIEKIEKQINIGNKILELVNQSFVLLTNKDYAFQIITLNDYKKIIENIVLNKKTKNIFIDNLITIELVTRNSIIIFFTQSGKYYSSSINKLLKVKDLKDFFDVDFQDKIIDVLSIDNNLKNLENKNLIFATRNGFVKRTKINLFLNECLKSDFAIKLYEKDLLVNVRISNDEHQISLGTKFGKLVRFDVNKIKPTLKKTYGKIGMNILEDENNKIIGLTIIDDFEDCVLVITENSKIKKSLLEDYRITNRGGKGVKTINLTQKSGLMSHIEIVNDKNICLLITNLNNIFLLETFNLRIVGRAAEPTNAFKLNENEKINSIIKIPNLNWVKINLENEL